MVDPLLDSQQAFVQAILKAVVVRALAMRMSNAHAESFYDPMCRQDVHRCHRR
jgi:hypothetical protein